MSIETLYENEWLSLKTVREPDKGVNNYIYSYESSCQGRKVAVLPYRVTIYGFQFLVKSEITPCWSMEPIMSAVTGGYEGIDIKDDAVREMLEETGYSISEKDLISLGTCYAGKSSDTVYDLFAVDVTGKEPGEILGDGTRLESEAKCYWIEISDAIAVQDAQFSTMLLRFFILDDRVNT